MRDSFKGNGGTNKSNNVNDLVRANASDAESDIYVIGSRPASQNQDRTTTVPGFTPP